MSNQKSINDHTHEISIWRAGKGFQTPTTLSDEHNRDMMLGKLMLIVTEISEAAEAVRHEDRNNFEEELADATIRIFDICGTMGINLEAAINQKMEVNRGRPRLHGKKTTL